MKRHWSRNWIVFVPVAITGIVVFTAVGGFAVRELWNWLLPPLFGVPAVSFWQAIGLLALCRILFGGPGFMHGRGGGRWRSARDRWDSLTPEERERFRQGLRDRLEKLTPEEHEPLRQGLRDRWESLTPEERERFRQALRERCGAPPAGAGDSKEPV
jgi:hypothetical protein